MREQSNKLKLIVPAAQPSSWCTSPVFSSKSEFWMSIHILRGIDLNHTVQCLIHINIDSIDAYIGTYMTMPPASWAVTVTHIIDPALWRLKQKHFEIKTSLVTY